MKREDTDALIQRLEAAARRNPKLYVVRVAMLAVLGYGYLFDVLMITMLLTVGIVYLAILAPPPPAIYSVWLGAIAIVCGGFGLAIVRSLIVRLEAPKRHRLSREQVPDLYAELDEIRRKLRAGRAHEVQLDGDLNAAVVQVPRLGFFGWQRNYLILGLPLMQALSADEFRAVLAHEFAHLSHNHARFGAWIYRIRRTWERVFERMGQRKSGGTLALSDIPDQVSFWSPSTSTSSVNKRR
jgi:Zn-dependent protease with chaperone function